MFCMKCGQELPAQAKYCFNCGNRVEAEEESAKSIASQEGSLRESGTMKNNAVSLLEFRQNAPSMTGFRDELISYRKSLSNSWDYNAYVGILLGVGGPKHGDAACMNYAIGQGDNGNNTKKTLEAKGLMPVFEKYKGKKIDEAVMLSDVEDEIIAVAPEYAQIRQRFHEIVRNETTETSHHGFEKKANSQESRQSQKQAMPTEVNKDASAVQKQNKVEITQTENTIGQTSLYNKFPEESLSNSEKIIFVGNIIKNEYKIVRRYDNVKKIIAICKTEYDTEETYLVDYDEEKILKAFDQFFLEVHNANAQRKDDTEIVYTWGYGANGRSYTLKKGIMRFLKTSITSRKYNWNLKDDELYVLRFGEVYKLNIRAIEERIEVDETRVEGSAGPLRDNHNEIVGMKWRSNEKIDDMPVCVILFDNEGMPKCVMHGILNPQGDGIFPFFIYGNHDHIIGEDNGIKWIAMNLFHWEYGLISDFSAKRYNIFTRDLKNKTQYFVRIADASICSQDYLAGHCRYYEFVDGNMVEIDFEKLKQYNKTNYKVRSKMHWLNLPHEHIFK